MSGRNLSPAVDLPGMKAWLCEYNMPDGQYCIVLHGSEPRQILEDNCDQLAGLVILGEHVGSVEAEA